MPKFNTTVLSMLLAACSVEHTIDVGTQSQPLVAVPRHRCLAACDHALVTGNLEHRSVAACAIDCEDSWSAVENACPAALPALDAMLECYLASAGVTTPSCQYLFHPSVTQTVAECPEVGVLPAPLGASGVMSGTNCSELAPDANTCSFEMTSTLTLETLRVDCDRAPGGERWSCACFAGDSPAFAELEMDGEPDLTWYTQCFSETFMGCFNAGRAIAECPSLVNE